MAGPAERLPAAAGRLPWSASWAARLWRAAASGRPARRSSGLWRAAAASGWTGRTATWIWGASADGRAAARIWPASRPRRAAATAWSARARAAAAATGWPAAAGLSAAGLRPLGARLSIDYKNNPPRLVTPGS